VSLPDDLPLRYVSLPEFLLIAEAITSVDATKLAAIEPFAPVRCRFLERHHGAHHLARRPQA
jgi:hypothetical protein